MNNTFLRPVLEYASVIWDGRSLSDSDLLENSNNVHRGILQTIQASRDSSLCASSMLQDFYHLFFICKNKFHVLDFYGYFTMVKRV